jgi:PAS domain S-box-containing protein
MPQQHSETCKESDVELFRLLIENVTDYAIFALDPQGNVASWHPGAERIKGYKADEIIGQHFSKFYPQDALGRRCPGDELKVATVEGRFEDEGWRLRKDGTQFWAKVVITALKNEHGQLQGFSKITKDLTGRNQAEESTRFLAAEQDSRNVVEDSEWRIRASEERLRLALDAGRMGVWDWNIRTGDLKWSDSLEPLHGLAPGTFGGTFEHFQALIHPDDRDAVNDAIQQALEGSGEFYVEFRNVWHGGGIHWIAGSGKVYYDDGSPSRMIGIGMDVTRRKRAEQTAQFLADASAALAVLVDFDGTLQKVANLAVPYFTDWVSVDVLEESGNLRRVAVAHVDPAKMDLAHDLYRRFPPDPSAPNGVWNILRTGEAEIVAEITDDMLVASVKNEELLDIMRELGLKSYIGVPLTVRGRTVGVLTFIAAESGHVYDNTDLTVAKDLASRAAIAVENSQLNQELREADQRKDEFLATLAHELRNPLAPIRTGLHVLKLAGGGGDTGDEVRSMMERQITHMVRLIDDLLDVSRITRNKLELRRERVTLATVIHTAVETSRPLIDEGEHTFSMTLTPFPVYLDADPVRLAQVISNLLTNAAKYTERGGRITLTAESQGTEAVVRVRDNGLGIPVADQAHIFEMFSQVDRNPERAQVGLGIGLMLVERLTAMHGGSVEVESAGRGQGSEFIVRIPVLNEVRQCSAEGATGPEVVAGSQRRILVVDDNRDAAETLGMMLKLMGNEIRTANDGLAAVEVAEAFRPEMILMDIGLPKLSGYDACRRIRSQAWSEGMVIVPITGWGQEDDRRHSQEAGFDYHLVKPVNFDKLAKLLAQVD